MSDVETVRLLIADTSTDPTKQLLDDFQLQVLLDLEGGNIKTAAADALDAIATSEALVSKAITANNLTTNGPAVAAALRAHAGTLREQADSDALPVVVEYTGGWPAELAEWPAFDWSWVLAR